MLSSEPVLDSESTAAETIAIVVDVNERGNCTNKELLYIGISVADGNGVFLSSNVSFSDGVVTLASIFPGVYACTISVLNGSSTESLESVDIACQTISEYNNFTARNPPVS